MATLRYAYAYAVINSDGWCLQVKDSSVYVEDKYHIPLENYNADYLFKYYYPVPTEYGDFNGEWYYDAAHTQVYNPNA